MSETGRPGRYSRSFDGLLAALAVTVVGVVAFAGLRSLTDDSEPYEPPSVDYLETVAQAQDGGVDDLVYPPSLPAGWRATDVDYSPGEVPSFGVSVLTEGGAYIGLQQADADLDDLLDEYVDPDREEIDPLVVEGGVAPRWAGSSDAGGDTAYAAQVGDRQVVVFGSASPAELAAVVTSLTADRLPTG